VKTQNRAEFALQSTSHQRLNSASGVLYSGESSVLCGLIFAENANIHLGMAQISSYFYFGNAYQAFNAWVIKMISNSVTDCFFNYASYFFLSSRRHRLSLLVN